MIKPVLERVADGAFRELPVTLAFWDGSSLPAPAGESDATLRFRSPQAFNYMLSAPGELGLSRAWVAGELDVDGDIELVLGWRARFQDARLTAADKLRMAATAVRVAGGAALRRPPRLDAEAHQRGHMHSLVRDRVAISHHYDVSNAFYRQVLGPTMVYSCAYFDSPDDTLEEAQERKLELICRKLALKPGDRLLDIGCGWGSLIMQAAAHHGVTALGVTLSEAQAQLARERVREAGLEDRCEVRVCDYRELREGKFDAVASVGMYEHVGRGQLGTYVRTVKQLLKPGGAFLNHGITQLTPIAPHRRTFVNRFVFPDGELHPLTDVLNEMHAAGLEIRDVESLREHYTLTLRLWVQNLEAGYEQAVGEVGEARTRVWRLYMSGSAAAFAAGAISVFQTLAINDGGEHRLPLNRARGGVVR
ncbi:MAG TPA: class I SAM-dependent methyltransferase [Solirubrobacteraceae bacterium]|nr:class I SAM-dependent methyltransferase [Solirubrobacteraceae bacterium]